MVREGMLEMLEEETREYIRKAVSIMNLMDSTGYGKCIGAEYGVQVSAETNGSGSFSVTFGSGDEMKNLSSMFTMDPAADRWYRLQENPKEAVIT